MGYCPNCGAGVSDNGTNCPDCGYRLADPERVAADRRPRTGSERSGGRANGQGPREGAGESRQRRGSVPGQRGRQQSERTPHHRGGQGADARSEPVPGAGRQSGVRRESPGLSRRQVLLAGAGTALVASGVGWYAFLRDSGSGPTDVVRRFWTAWKTVDLQTYRQQVHSESPIRDNWGPEFRDQFGPESGYEWTLQSTTLVDQTGSEATVRAVYIVRSTGQGQSFRVVREASLREEGDEWKIWDTENVESSPIEE